MITDLGYECHDEELEQVRFFQQVADCVDFKDWYFGHLHEDVDVENFHCRMLERVIVTLIISFRRLDLVK